MVSSQTCEKNAVDVNLSTMIGVHSVLLRGKDIEFYLITCDGFGKEIQALSSALHMKITLSDTLPDIFGDK